MLKTAVWRSYYQDSVVLMRMAADLREGPGIREVAALMGTPANRDLLAQSGLATAESGAAGPEDLVLVLDAQDEASGAAAVEAARAFLSQRRATAMVDGVAGFPAPRTLDAALGLLPQATLAAISVPGAYARFEAMRALRRGLHVFLFSDNVPLEDELALKAEALRRGLLMMGPDCGTAYLNGVGLGFFNRVPRGRVGCVAASGTGLQAVASHLSALGEGISQAIGVGGRDLSQAVGGLMSHAALQALARDARSEAIVLISKPPHPSVLPGLQAALQGLGKPVIVCCLGAVPEGTVPGGPLSGGPLPEGGGPAQWVETLEDAAQATVARLAGKPWQPRPFEDAPAIRKRLRALRATEAGRRAATGALVGLFTGGTLAHEARLLLESRLGALAFNPPLHDPPRGHRLADLGDDLYTVGRAHPMIDPRSRAEALAHAVEDPAVGLVLIDLVLGSGVHEDPAGSVVAALGRAGAARPLVIASVLGTAGDPQGLAGQVTRLGAAGVEVLPSNAQAARFAALLANPAAAAAWLEEA